MERLRLKVRVRITLRRLAELQAEELGHVMGPWERPAHNSGIVREHSTCELCDRTARITYAGAITGFATKHSCPQGSFDWHNDG